MMDLPTAIANEARRQEESCLYTSTSLYLWLRRVRLHNSIFVVAPIVLGALASFSVLKESLEPWAIATLSLIASLFPALATGLKIQTSVSEIAASAAAYKALQDRFRQLAAISVLADPSVAEKELRDLMDRLDVARSNSITAPEKWFAKARKKIESGDYRFAVDATTRKT